MTEREAIEIIKNTRIKLGRANGKDLINQAFNLATTALEKQIAKKPIHANGNYYCPTCKDTWLLWDDAIPNEHDNFCGECGQRIWWGE